MNGNDWATALNTGFILVSLVGIIMTLILFFNKRNFKKR